MIKFDYYPPITGVTEGKIILFFHAPKRTYLAIHLISENENMENLRFVIEYF